MTSMPMLAPGDIVRWRSALAEVVEVGPATHGVAAAHGAERIVVDVLSWSSGLVHRMVATTFPQDPGSWLLPASESERALFYRVGALR